jgi:uncharacterized membrane protein required for colicin V production
MAIGYKKGLFRTVLGTAATIVALLLAYFLTPIVSQLIIEHTVVDDYVENKVYDIVKEQVRSKTEAALQKTAKENGLSLDTAVVSDSQLNEIMNSTIGKAQQVEMIDSLSFPSYIKTSLLDNNHSEVYEKLQVDNVYRYISKYVAYMVVNMCASVLTFLLVRLFLMIFTITMNTVLRTVPLVAGVDHIGGMLVGAVTAVIITWVFLILCGMIFGTGAENMITDSTILSAINEKNVLQSLITNITDILFK